VRDELSAAQVSAKASAQASLGEEAHDVDLASRVEDREPPRFLPHKSSIDPRPGGVLVEIEHVGWIARILSILSVTVSWRAPMPGPAHCSARATAIQTLPEEFA
jgi:hypothetical protein